MSRWWTLGGYCQVDAKRTGSAAGEVVTPPSDSGTRHLTPDSEDLGAQPAMVDGSQAVEAGIAGFVDLAHVASPEGGNDLIRTKPNAGGERDDPPGGGNREPAEL